MKAICTLCRRTDVIWHNQKEKIFWPDEMEILSLSIKTFRQKTSRTSPGKKIGQNSACSGKNSGPKFHCWKFFSMTPNTTTKNPTSPDTELIVGGGLRKIPKTTF